MSGMETDGARWPWRSTGLIVAYSVLLVAWLLIKPGSHALFVGVDNVAQFFGLLLVFPLCLIGGARRPDGGEQKRLGLALKRPRQWAPILLGFSVLSEAIGQIIYTVYEQVLRYPTAPFPSWADAAYLTLYPSLLLGILLLPTRRLALTARTRVLLDGLMIMIAVITFSWYFILGPTILQRSTSVFATLVGAAYPVCDLVLIFCLLLLSGHFSDPRLRRPIGTLMLALAIIIVTDSIYDLQQLHSAYATGELLDVGWPLGYMLVGLAGRALRLSLSGKVCSAATVTATAATAATAEGDVVPGTLPLWRTLLPYTLIPAVGLLLLSTLRSHDDASLTYGVYIGCAVLIGLIVLRQVIAFLENSRLYGYLRDAYGQLEERNRETVAYAGRLERLNQELRDMHDNNRALAEANELLETMATTDALTKLTNRTLLNDRLEQALHLGERHGTPVALLLMDLDRFKEVNDTLGHHYGDVLLQQVGLRMQNALRASDTVARLGGDEFAVLLPDTDEASAVQVARAIVDMVALPFVVEGQTLDVGVSVGIALYPAHGVDAATLLRQADVAMYVAKRAHSGYAIYDAAQDQNSSYRLALMSELRHALAAGELLLYYQPLVDLKRGQLTGVEALLRWPHPQRGFIPPDHFIPLAEHTGLIAPLTEWVLEGALRQCQEWQRGGLMLNVQVNLSMRVLHDTQLPETVARLLRRYDVAPEWLTLEITESALMVDPTRALEVLSRLSEIGVRVAIDDFGTGYSSLAYLKRLPVHEVKIDKSFVLGMDEDNKDKAIVRSVVAMAHAMGLDVVAEGVENTEAWGMLRSLACDVAQGYYLSRPLPAADLERWIGDSPWAEKQASA